ncbi:MAG: DUF29 domain-containing protein [Candidatus Contendobacter sp.]
MDISHSYDQDFYAWLIQNVQLMRNHQLHQIDVEHIAEELEAMAKSEKRELLNRLCILLMHLLKWQYQIPKRTRSWHNTIMTQRIDLMELLEDSPSLKLPLLEKLQGAYEKAKIKAEDETGIDQQQFPEQCPYTLEQILSSNFFPGESSNP